MTRQDAPVPAAAMPVGRLAVGHGAGPAVVCGAAARRHGRHAQLHGTGGGGRSAARASAGARHRVAAAGQRAAAAAEGPNGNSE